MSMFIHSITHVHTPYTGSLDDYGQPAAGTAVETIVKGLVQPSTLRAREQDDSRGAGSEVADYLIFLPVMDVGPSDHFIYGGDRYDVIGIRRFDFGRLRHLEVDARRVVAAVVA